MPDNTTIKVPKYRLHKPSGQGVVRLSGRDFYLGKHGTVQSMARYEQAVAEWIANHRQLPEKEVPGPSSELTVNELFLAYWDFAQQYYVKDDRPTGELPNIKDAARSVVSLCGMEPVRSFGPLALKAVRDRMIREDLSRKVINARVNRIRRMFKWGVENQLLEPSVLHALQAVAPLKKGRCGVREAPGVHPVADRIVDETVQHAPPQIAAMIELQRFTGMRPGEVTQMRTADLDTTGKVWTYQPASHKTEHHDRERVIYIGPRAQRALMPFLRPDLNEYLFRPCDVVADLRKRARAHRRTPMMPSQVRRKPKKDAKRSPGRRYTTGSYAIAIRRACDKAFPLPEYLAFEEPSAEQREQIKLWRREHRWSPNQLRHNAATYLRKEFGIEVARVVLGHSSAAMTEVYAELDQLKAAEVMAQVG